LDGAKAYKDISPELYGWVEKNKNFGEELIRVVEVVSKDSKFDRYYKNKKEGYFQNELSRMFGICGNKNNDFVILDKEAVIGYSDNAEKEKLYGELRSGYKTLQKELSEKNTARYGKKLEKKSIGNELDFLALDKQGNLRLIEYKHGTNTSGIYLSPLQIGMYYDLFTQLPKEELIKSVSSMFEQKKKIGLINPDWGSMPEIKEIIPVLIISEYNYKSTANKKYHEVMDFVRSKRGGSFLGNIKTFNYTTEEGLTSWRKV